MYNKNVFVGRVGKIILGVYQIHKYIDNTMLCNAPIYIESFPKLSTRFGINTQPLRKEFSYIHIITTSLVLVLMHYHEKCIISMHLYPITVMFISKTHTLFQIMLYAF